MKSIWQLYFTKQVASYIFTTLFALFAYFWSLSIENNNKSFEIQSKLSEIIGDYNIRVQLLNENLKNISIVTQENNKYENEIFNIFFLLFDNKKVISNKTYDSIYYRVRKIERELIYNKAKLQKFTGYLKTHEQNFLDVEVERLNLFIKNSNNILKLNDYKSQNLKDSIQKLSKDLFKNFSLVDINFAYSKNLFESSSFLNRLDFKKNENLCIEYNNKITILNSDNLYYRYYIYFIILFLITLTFITIHWGFAK